VRLSLAGLIDPRSYRLVMRPQPLAVPDRFRIEINSAAGVLRAGLVSTVAQPSLLDSSGLAIAKTS